MDFKPVKITMIFLLIITSTISFRAGMNFGGYVVIPKVTTTNPESLYIDSSYQIPIFGITTLEYQDSQNDKHTTQLQSIVVDEGDDDIIPNFQYTNSRPQDLQNLQSLEYDPQVIVAILDTGIDNSHEILCPVIGSEIDFTDSPFGVVDLYGHGTPVTGVVVYTIDHSFREQGFASNYTLLNVKVVGDRGRFDMTNMVDGIIWAVDNGANIINISIVSEERSTDLERAINYAWQNGALIIAAAGNNGTNIPVYPAAYEHCIAVTAVDDYGNLVPLANYGDWVDIAAPGYKIYSSLPGNEYGYVYGTSFAAAYISGLAATIFPLIQDSNDDGKSNDEIRQFILHSSPDEKIQQERN